MIRYILAFLVVSTSVVAQEINPLLPVARIESGVVVQKALKIPSEYGTTVKYDKASEMWNGDGWVQADVTTVSSVVTSQIPAEVQQVASEYKTMMEGFFGSGAVTNQTFDKSYVTVSLSLNTNVTADSAVRLRAWYEILSGYWKKELWDFPWDQSEYTTLYAEGVYEPYLYATPDKIDFGTTVVGDTSTGTFQMFNERSTDITGTVSVSGAPFAMTSPSSFTLAPGDSLSFSLAFTPTLEDEFTGSVTINSNAGVYTNELTGLGWEE